MELIVEAEHLGEFLVREAMSGEQLSGALNAPRESIAGRRFASESGEFFSKVLIAHATSPSDGPQSSSIIRRRPLQKVQRLKKPSWALFSRIHGTAV